MPVGLVAHNFGTDPKMLYCTHMDNKATAMTFQDALTQLEAFVTDTRCDLDMAYDWVCEMLDIDGFVENEAVWNDFYNTWESADNRNTIQHNFA